MAKIYDEKEIEDLEKQAALKQHQAAAMKILEPEKTDPVSAMSAMNSSERQEFLRSQEQKRTNEWHQRNMDARARRLQGMLGAEGGRYSPFAISAARKYLEENGYGQEGERRRQFDVTNETTRKVSENEMNGKINYGKGAAEVKAGADITMNKNEWETRSKIAEQEAAARKYLGDQDAATRKYGIDAEHGKIGEDGKVTPGSRERTAQIQGESEVQKQEAANKGLLAQAEITRQNKEKELATQIEKAQIAAGGKTDSSKIASHAKIISAALQGGALQNKDAGTVLAELAEQYNNDPEMLSSIKSAGGGQQQQPQIPGYSPEKVAELQKRGYKWDGKQWVKPE